jgi:putative DNA primase/helicase
MSASRKEYRSEGAEATVKHPGEARRAAERYLRQGIAIIPIPRGQKSPNRRHWQHERWAVEDIPRCWSNGQGIGVLTGEPSGWLVDVDLDCSEAVEIARRFLDPTLTSGRESAPDSHWWYRSEGVRSMSFEDLGGPEAEMILEIRSNGRQTLVAPSRHPSGERYAWSNSGLQFRDAQAGLLVRACRELATAALVGRSLPSGGRHRIGLSLAGFLLRRSLEPETVEKIMHAAWDVAGFPSERARREAHADIEAIVRDTAAGLEEGSEVSGGRVLGQLVAGLPQKLARFWGWSSFPSEAESGPSPEQRAGHKGLTVDLAEAILSVTPFAQNAGGRLHYFAFGTYQAQGEKFVAARVKALLGEWGMLQKWSSYRASEVAKFIAADAPELWERPPLERINLANGILDLETRSLRSHSPDWLSTVQIPVFYDAEAACPAWEKQVAETFPDDAQGVAWEIVADLVRPDRSEQVAVILVGEGNNGKSAFLENVAHLLGRRNRVALSLHRIETDRFAAARLVGKLANICPDLPSTDLASTSTFKAITGGDEITGEFKYGDSFNFVPFCRLMFSANHLPRSQDASFAFFRRWRVISFDKTFEGCEAIPRRDLDAKLQDPGELSGVLNKALDALPTLRERGFTESPSMAEAWQEFRETTDPMAVWLDRWTVEEPDAWTPKDVLARAYNDDCARTGRAALSKKAIAQALKRLRPHITDGQKMVSGKSQTVWRGLGLRSPVPPDGATSGSEHDTKGDESLTVSTVSTVSTNCLQQEKDEESTDDRGEEGATNNNGEKPFKPFKPFKPLSVEEVVRELRRPNSGARINLPLYLAGETTLEILTKSVLVARGISTAAWEEHAGVVERASADPRNHGVECECKECLP